MVQDADHLLPKVKNNCRSKQKEPGKLQDLSWTSLQVVRDRGVSVVYAGFGLMIAGLFLVSYLNPWLESKESQR